MGQEGAVNELTFLWIRFIICSWQMFVLKCLLVQELLFMKLRNYVIYKSIVNIEYVDWCVFLWSAKLQEELYLNCFTFYKARYFHYVFVFSFSKTRWPTNLNMDGLHVVSSFVLWRVIFDVILDDSYPDYFVVPCVTDVTAASFPVLHTESRVSSPRRILFRICNQAGRAVA